MKESRKEFIKKLHLSATTPWKTKIKEEFPKIFKEDANTSQRLKKMNKSKKEVIKKMHQYACDASKLIIENEFPKLFKKEEKANGWYKDARNEWFMFFENGIMKYGVNVLGEWKENLSHNYTFGHNDYKATDKEAKEVLIKEAKKTGFKEGVCFIPTNGTKVVQMASEDRWTLTSEGKLLFCNFSVFENGVWAEIIKEPIVKDVLEVGKWYKSNHCCIFKYNGFKDCEDDPCGYGFSNKGTWFKSNLIGWSGTYTLATNEEVQQAHIKEAKHIGYKGGDNIGNFNGCGKEILYNSNYNFSTNSGLFYVGGCCVCEKGEWATIVETITRKQAEKELGKVITD
jgi:hypothetical protein